MFQTMLRPGLLSAFILTTFSRPAHAAATFSSTESRIRQGRLQAAENPTRTGSLHLSTSDSKFASPISMIGPLSGSVFISLTPFRIHKLGVLRVLRQTWWAWPEGLDRRSERTHSFRTSPQNFPLSGQD